MCLVPSDVRSEWRLLEHMVRCLLAIEGYTCAGAAQDPSSSSHMLLKKFNLDLMSDRMAEQPQTLITVAVLSNMMS